MGRIVRVCLTALWLAGCAATPYQPAGSGGYGYSEDAESGGAYLVTFAGNTASSQQQVDDFALLRAAELAASQGYASLSVADRRDSIIARSIRGSGAPSDVPTTAPSARGVRGNPSGYSVNGSSGGGTQVRVCMLRVQFYKHGDAVAGAPVQDVQALLTKLRGEYGLSAAGH